MKKLELFQCEICGEQYTVEDACKRCESNHMIPQEVVKCEYPVSHLGHYPDVITILMSDGVEVKYYK